MPPNIPQPGLTIGPTTPVHLKGVATVKIDWPTPVMDSTRYLQLGYPHQAAEYHQDVL
jgi:hypothetical protein